MNLNRDLTFKQIRAFEAVVRTASITRASEELCVTPPAISSQIKSLKHLVGAEILTREQTGLVPTRVGLEILALHERILSAINTSAQKIEAIKTGMAGDVGIAVVSTGKYFAPQIFSAFMAAFPDIKLRPMIGNRRLVLSALENRAADLAIMGRPPARLDVLAETLGDHPNIIIAAPDHPLAKERNITPEQLLKHTLLLRELGSGTRMLARRFMDRFGDGINYPVMEVGSNESIKQSVMAGLGIAMISAHTVMAELDEGRLVMLDVPGMPIVRQWILVRLRGVELSGAAKSFHDFVLKNSESFIPKIP